MITPALSLHPVLPLPVSTPSTIGIPQSQSPRYYTRASPIAMALWPGALRACVESENLGVPELLGLPEVVAPHHPVLPAAVEAVGGHRLQRQLVRPAVVEPRLRATGLSVTTTGTGRRSSREQQTV